MCDRLASADAVALDTETVIVRNPDGTTVPLGPAGIGAGPLRVISIAARYGTDVTAWVVDVNSIPVSPETAAVYRPQEGGTPIDLSAVADRFSTMHVYAWNADFDEAVLERAGLRLGAWTDLMLVRALANLGGSGERVFYSLAQAAQTYLGVQMGGKETTRISYTESGPLTVDQVKYAAIDAVVTLRLAPVLNARADEAGVGETVKIESAARPFRAWMEKAGIAFDVAGWREFLAGLQPEIDRLESTLAELTGGGQGSLFDHTPRPSWNIASPDAVKQVLNTYASDAIADTLGRPKLAKADSVDTAALERLGHPIADAVLAWRELEKLRSTYGENFINFVADDGRIHAEYVQAQVGTGRLSSNHPNMQNLAPQQKPYFRPPNAPKRAADGEWVIAPHDRVLVMADLGQAELRALAHESQDEALLEAFRAGEDMHVVTASRMFGIDMEGLKSPDLATAVAAGGSFASPIVEEVASSFGLAPNLESIVADEQASQALREGLAKLFAQMRRRGKTMNFAVIYGLGPASLADTLTRAGVPTTVDEAKEQQRRYFDAFEGVKAYLKAADDRVASIAESLPDCDFVRSRRLASELPRLIGAKKALHNQTGVWPSASEAAEHAYPSFRVASELQERLGRKPSADEVESHRRRLIDEGAWMLSLPAAVVVTRDGKPFAFYARTVSGRRRTFNVGVTSWLRSAGVIAASSKKDRPSALRRAFEEQSSVRLSVDGRPLSRQALEKVFENKALLERWLSFVETHMPSAMPYLFRRALADNVRRFANAVRNTPIQGGVADAVLEAFGLLATELPKIDGAVPVQSVHDSLVVECDAADALQVAELLERTMAAGMRRFFPSVPPLVDVEIAASLDAKADRIPVEAFAELTDVSSAA